MAQPWLLDPSQSMAMALFTPLVVVMIYVMIEAYRYHRMLKLQRHLHDHRTPLSDGFDRKQWAVFMLTALRLSLIHI